MCVCVCVKKITLTLTHIIYHNIYLNMFKIEMYLSKHCVAKENKERYT